MCGSRETGGRKNWSWWFIAWLWSWLTRESIQFNIAAPGQTQREWNWNATEKGTIEPASVCVQNGVFFLWCIQTRKGCSAPSYQCLQSCNAGTTAKSSWLPTSQFFSVADRQCEKKTQGCIFCSTDNRCDWTAPSPDSEASTSTMNWKDGSGFLNKEGFQLSKGPGVGYRSWCEASQRRSYLTVILNEPYVEIYEAKKMLVVLSSCR